MIARLEAAAGRFAAATDAAAGQGRTIVDHPFFGRVTLPDYSTLQAIHTRHHAAQLGTAGTPGGPG